MHELSVCQALLTQVENLARERNASQVLSVSLGIGPLSGVEPALLSQAWPLAAAGTVADNAELLIEERPVRVRCSQCGEESDATANRLLCARCGDWRTQLLSGDDLLLLQVELETAYV
ncbi:MAG: hydrogenase maturation nickel metallochaperone HypA [Thiogranum sp.]|nr:hydrogenase maturation nickel metallochaperone HypA [Thiogranum sp.]